MKQSRRGLRQAIESCRFFKIEKFPAEDPVRGLGQGVPRMTAAVSLRDSSSVLVADLGKGRVMPQRTAACLPLPLHPSPKETAGGGGAALETSCSAAGGLPPRDTSAPHNTAAMLRAYFRRWGCVRGRGQSRRYAVMASSGLPAMNRYGLFNRPVQGSVPATPENPMTTEVFLLFGNPGQPSADWIPLKCSSL
jgi:hypothetical protein